MRTVQLLIIKYIIIFITFKIQYNRNVSFVIEKVIRYIIIFDIQNALLTSFTSVEAKRVRE